VAVRQAALVSDESALEACACSQRCPIQIGDLYLFTFSSSSSSSSSRPSSSIAVEVVGTAVVSNSKPRFLQFGERDSHCVPAPITLGAMPPHFCRQWIYVRGSVLHSVLYITFYAHLHAFSLGTETMVV